MISNFCPIRYGATPEEEDEHFTWLSFYLMHLQRLINRFYDVRSAPLSKQRWLEANVTWFLMKGLPGDGFLL